MRAFQLLAVGLVALLSSFAQLVDSHALPHNATIKGRALNSFDFTTGNGNCANYMAKLGRWVPDISVLADSAIKALDDINKEPYSLDIRYTLGNFLGIYAHEDADGVAAVRKWFSDVKSFSEGNFGAFGYSKAFMFCGDNYQEPKSPYDVAKEENGDPVTINGQQKSISQISEYANLVNSGFTPFWIKALGGYLFAAFDQFRPGTPGDRCKVAFAFNSYPVKQKSSITFCIYPSTAAQGQVPVDYFAAETIVQARSFTGTGELIDGDASGSSIMMHEMFHATKGNDVTPDFAKTSAQCTEKVLSGAANEAQASPQCAVLFAIAMDLMYAGGVDQNRVPKHVYWWKGEAMSNTDAFANMMAAIPN